jgi:hypothetical protein
MQQLRHQWEMDVVVSFTDDQGDAAQVQGDPQWVSNDVNTIAIVATSDPFTATLQAVGAVGSTTGVSVSADADLGEGVVPVQASDDITIVSGVATSAAFSYSAPRPITPA